MSPRSGVPPALRAAVPVGIVGAVMLFFMGVCVGFPCFSTGLRYGLWVDRCPATDLRLDVQAGVYGALRGSSDGLVWVRPRARWLSSAHEPGTEQSGHLVRGYRVNATLRRSDGTTVEGVELGRLEYAGGERHAALTLPDLPDDDYELHLEVVTGFETTLVEVPLPLFAPALAHAMTDRPLYKPGQEVLLRSVVLDRRDQTPIESRPGRWRITDPGDNVVLEERDRGDDWGIADTSFPLDRNAPHGTWRATWESGGARDDITFEVRPFQLPRLTATASPTRPWFRVGDELTIEGRATYTSGAPVANAPVQVVLRHTTGRWPMPIAWEEPRAARTARDGTFRVSWGPVPGDLMDFTELIAAVTVTEAAGEAVGASSMLKLSPEALRVEAVTELGDGLVGDFNNRAYLRVATPDGTPLRRAAVTVKNPWDPLGKSIEATTDEDGVAAVQIDPGDPVTVVLPAPPLRVRPFLPDPPRLASGQDVRGGSLELADRRGLDQLHPAIASCGQYATSNTKVKLAVQVRANGTVRRVLGPDDRLGRCVARATQRARFARGEARVLTLQWLVPDTRQPWLAWDHRLAWGQDVVHSHLTDAALAARRCLTRGQGSSGSPVFTVQWHVAEGSRRIDTEVRRHANTGLSPSTLSCVAARLAGLRLDEPAPEASMGESVATLRIPQAPGQEVPQAITRTAYELEVSAALDGQDMGSGRIVLEPGVIPAVRLRATPSLADPGAEVVVEVFRGPQYGGDLPDELELMHGSVELQEVELEENAATFTIPDHARGFLHVDWAGARTVIYVRDPNPLAVTVSTDAAAYRPGDTAALTVRTLAGDSPRAAAVGLVGVDEALSQLAPLLPPDDYGRITVRAESQRPAFGTFDPKALALGRLRGENAAKATLLRISELPMDAAGDERISTDGETRVDTETDTLAAFYRALEATIARVRAWEEEAPESEKLDPERMVALYRAALADLRSDGEPAVDAFGRELRLTLLPGELLAQLEPQQVVSDATRLPEDLVSLERHVREEVAR